MQINSINNSINFNAYIGPRLKEAIDRNYSPIQRIFSKKYKNIINRIANSAPDRNTIEMDRSGRIYITGKNTNRTKLFLIEAKFIDMATLVVDSQVIDEIVNKIKGIIA